MRTKSDGISNETRLIEAALRCIANNGISKTFVEDIAQEAGLSRPTAYRTFGTRKALLEGVAAHCANRMKDTMRKRLTRYKSFSDAVVLGSTEALDMARKDKVLILVFEALGDSGLERYLLDPKGPVIGYTLNAWNDWFDDARKSGELRPDVSNDELATLLTAGNVFFLLRTDFSKSEQIAFLRKFLLPSILARPDLQQGQSD
ncbi:TetR/AcrR family transcriptional regulator (plasmid) [Diaphorobacter sp. HDW4B]|uniref:TetR/AcrR family transcriptional regulator n=1 Tax=Diaphorobacter sp. HDW4B TaxID=2714925 RepID=UPI0014087AD6|nr:TetR/AcrR family transcriptional regulator [Diaphorobacter sp. HDW4B]QIL74003.1 TetR/AcrR family transcriptional regulator [Diaphorobacter sp. HDW4B]